MNSVVIVVLALAAVASAGVVGPVAYGAAPLAIGAPLLRSPVVAAHPVAYGGLAHPVAYGGLAHPVAYGGLAHPVAYGGLAGPAIIG